MSRDEITNRSIEVICDHLSDRSAALFLGAGINAGLTNSEGRQFPLARQLSTFICKDLLGTPDLTIDLTITLDEAAEMARFRLGERELNRYLYDLLVSFGPGTAHLSLVQLPWDIIYTTNYDLLVEQAAKVPAVVPAGSIRPVLSMDLALVNFSENDILYYKLHGSVDMANTEEGRLILTKEDYRHYKVRRIPLFRRLKRDLQNRAFVFVGYSLMDSDFRAILEDCREELNIRALPLSFACRPGFTVVEETFWREKYNIQLLNATAEDFLVALKETWVAQPRAIASPDSRVRDYLEFDQSTRFQKLGESFYYVRPSDCTGPSDPSLFFRGAEPSWGDIREEVPPKRDAYSNLLEALFPELIQTH